ncbi:MAG: BrnA antitoxin family protein [Chloroflexi bacterium]|nr:BrnA antitoxin family protein [Chloroflexota bacterium]MCI0581246.1 BrnA antitoxin family protein [Chloroflexota bacterium]MCI0648657.1 BrnA antitoxin family protein [Chloroflexota bacterium]MCI0728065.1 BrnA antitoxin family protein [Chloroflexota bacterium]
MDENKEQERSSISKATTLEELAEFWDTHSLADYWDETYEVEFEIRARRRRRVTLDPELYEKISKEAQLRGVEPETLVNLWLAERVSSG